MNKKTRSLVVLFALAAGSLVTLATSPASPVRAADPDTAALYKITSTESESTPIGCTGCQPQKTSIPTFDAQTLIGTSVASATKIDTFNTSAWDQSTNTPKTFSGGCAIVSNGLKCWGDNSYGQLG
ncbi:MAG: RCC1 domain-containing protein, partial [Actinobacteria bacterium]|nr:RCC1 domain-containing protein [Actinomycetota bacterium]